MNNEYHFENIKLKILNENNFNEVLHFYSKNKKTFEKFELDKPFAFYTDHYQQKLLSAEYQDFLYGRFVRFYMYDEQVSNQIIGTISFSDIKKGAFFSCQTGYKIDSDYTRQGYGYKMLKLAIPILQNEYHIHRFEAHILPDNIPSKKLAQKAGFMFEGISHAYVHMQGEWKDHLCYALISP